jgi:hypothetical protein
MKRVLVDYRGGERTFILHIDQQITLEDGISDLENLKNAFLIVARKDTYLNQKLIDHYPIFTCFDEQFKTYVELNASDKIENGQKVSLNFYPKSSPQKNQQVK